MKNKETLISIIFIFTLLIATAETPMFEGTIGRQETQNEASRTIDFIRNKKHPKDSISHQKVSKSSNILQASATSEYWVEAGASSDGTCPACSPAGNITYVLETYNLTNAIIHVKPGVYDNTCESFPLEFTDYSNVALKSTEGVASTIINGTGDSEGLRITTANFTISGFTIQNHKGGWVIDLAVGGNAAQDATITDNNISNNGKIRLESAERLTFTGNNITSGSGIYGNPINSTIIDNRITNNNDDGIVIEGGGDNIVKSNNISANDGNGLEILSSVGNTVKDNNITHNDDLGIKLDSGSTGNLFTENTISHNNETGITVSDSDGNLFKKNDILHNGMNGDFGAMYLGGSNDTEIKGNRITNNSRYGIFFKNSNHSIVKGNNITENVYGVKLELGSNGNATGNVIYQNNFIDNTMKNAEDQVGKNYFNGSWIGNYWDDYNGNDVDGDGRGDTSYNITDGDGNHTSTDFLPAMQQFDFQVPGIEIVEPMEDAVKLTNDVLVNWTEVSDGETVRFYAVRVDSGTWQNVSMNTEHTFNLEDGNHTVSVVVVDEDWETNITSVNFAVSTTPPSIRIESPKNITYTRSQVDVNISVFEGADIIYVIRAEIDSQRNITLVSNGANQYLNDTESFSGGPHNLRIYANDTEGRVNDTQTVSFTIDSSPPTVTIQSPENTTYMRSTLDINVTVTDTISPVDTVLAEIDESMNDTLSSVSGDLFSTEHSFSEGSHQLRIYANDTASNVNGDLTVHFTIETEGGDGTTGEGLPINLLIGISVAVILVILVIYLFQKKSRSK